MKKHTGYKKSANFAKIISYVNKDKPRNETL